MTPDIKSENLSTVLKDYFIESFQLGEASTSDWQPLIQIWTGGKLKGKIEQSSK